MGVLAVTTILHQGDAESMTCSSAITPLPFELLALPARDMSIFANRRRNSGHREFPKLQPGFHDLGELIQTGAVGAAIRVPGWNFSPVSHRAR